MLRSLSRYVLLALAIAFLPISATAQSWPEKLATIDGDGWVEEQDVKRFETLLPAIQRKYPEEGDQRVADVTVRGWELLEKRGVNMSLLKLMEGMNRAAPTIGTNVKYQKAVGMYVVFRSVESYSHFEAVVAVRHEL